MLSGILNSDKAINMNIAIMRAFVEIRRIIFKQNDLKEQMKEIREMRAAALQRLLLLLKKEHSFLIRHDNIRQLILIYILHQYLQPNS